MVKKKSCGIFVNLKFVFSKLKLISIVLEIHCMYWVFTEFDKICTRLLTRLNFLNNGWDIASFIVTITKL